MAPAVTEAAFTLPQGAVSDPITTDTGTAIVKVLEKQEVTPDRAGLEQGPLPRGAAGRSAEPLLQRLHGEGEAEDEDRGQPRGGAARDRLELQGCRTAGLAELRGLAPESCSPAVCSLSVRT